MKLPIAFVLFAALSTKATAQVDTAYVFNTSMPYGTLDIRTAKSSTRYYYLQTDRTFSYRESSPGVKTNTFRDMTSWDSRPYTQGNLREKNGSSDYFIMNYRLLFPNGYNASYDPGYPLIVMLHGAGERANCWDTRCYHGTRTWNPGKNEPPAPTSATHELLNNDHNLLHGGKAHLDARNAAGTRLPNDPAMPARAFPGFVLFPQMLNGWTGGTVQDAIRLVRLVARKYNIDPNRIYLHGLSNGGYATYEALKRAPWLFAAVLPMSAVSDAGVTTQTLAEAATVPLWIFQGGIDTAPTPARTEGYVKKLKDAGAIVRYSRYDHLGHGIWNTAYREPDFFSWMLAQNKTKIHSFAGIPSVCQTNGTGARLFLSAGFRHYQWERNGVIIAGATRHAYTATTAGAYRARFSRKANPGPADWEPWSPVVNVTVKNPARPVVTQVGSVLLKDLNGYNDARLRVARGSAHYYWYKNGARFDLPGTQDDTTTYPLIKATLGNGAYTVVVADYDDCPSPPSEPKNIFFNDSAPVNLAAPAAFTGTALSASSVRVNWSHSAAGEVGFEIWRRKTTGSVGKWVMGGLAPANSTTFTDNTGLEPSTTYQYKIRAAGNSGRSDYTPSSATQFLTITTGPDNVLPGAPSALVAEQSGINSIRLRWNAATDNTGIREYIVYYGTKTVATGSNTTTFNLTNLAVNQNYSFTVKAKDLGGNIGPASNSATANTFYTGLYYEHSTGSYSSLDGINWNIAEFTGKVNNFTLAPRTQEDYFNFRYDGYLYISAAGSYEFGTTSSDGSRVELDGVIVVDNNGIHGSRSTNGAARSLSAGPKRIVVKYFEYDGGHNLTVRYRGPDTGGTWKNIPDAVLRSSKPVTSAGIESEAVVLNETGVTEDERLAVYPNPATQHDLHVQLPDAGEGVVQVSMLDLSGKAVLRDHFDSRRVREGVHLQPAQTIPNGLYVIVVREPDRVTRRLVAIRN